MECEERSDFLQSADYLQLAIARANRILSSEKQSTRVIQLGNGSKYNRIVGEGGGAHVSLAPPMVHGFALIETP